ncbi:MAG: PH domain-containing protein [Oligoflexia bacterium]|nr:PH domain-containing protein [Oligoflexia bacterium]
MSYIKKTLTEDETIIISKKFHWIIWFQVIVIVFGIGLFWSFYYDGVTILQSGDDFSDFVMDWIFNSIIISISALFGVFIAYISTENIVTNKRVITKSLFLLHEIRNEDIENILIKQSIIGRIFGYGTLKFKVRGKPPCFFRTVPEILSVKKEIESVIYGGS